MRLELVSPELVRALSVCEITRPDKQLYTGLRCQLQHAAPGQCDGLAQHVSLGALCDARMGPRKQDERCVTCGGNYAQCTGHAGHLCLAAPVYNEQFVPHIKQLLQRLCPRCLARPLKHAHCLDSEQGCQERPCAVSWKEGMIRVVRPGRAEPEAWSAARLLSVFARWPEETRKKLFGGVDPSNMVLTVLYVESTIFRPWTRRDTGVWDCSTTTDHYSAIVKCNDELRARARDPPHIRENLLLQLQVAVSKLYDSKYIKSVSAIPDNAQQNSLLSGLTGKLGRFRGNLLGKRVNYTGRSVLTGDPRLRLNQIGVPQAMCAVLTMPEMVTAHSRRRLQELVKSGKGFASLTVSGQVYRTESLRRCQELAWRLKPGDVVARWLRSGDWVVVNRQPTLHRLGIQAMQVVAMPGSSLRINPNATTPFNAECVPPDKNSRPQL
jgi:DNA-directed RNA polymerase beta' subunit